MLDATGPFILTRACDAWTGGGIDFLAAPLFYPIDNHQIRNLPQSQWPPLLKDAYALHHWQGTWMRDAVLMDARNRLLKGRAVKATP